MRGLLGRYSCVGSWGATSPTHTSIREVEKHIKKKLLWIINNGTMYLSMCIYVERALQNTLLLLLYILKKIILNYCSSIIVFFGIRPYY